MPDASDPIEDALAAGDWAANGASATAVTAAVRALRRATSHRGASRANHQLLDAIGHNHSGHLYPAAAVAAPILVAIARETAGHARRETLGVLCDCLAWAEPDQVFTDLDGTTERVRRRLHQVVLSLSPLLQSLASTGDSGTARTATDLLEMLVEMDEETGDPGAAS